MNSTKPPVCMFLPMEVLVSKTERPPKLIKRGRKDHTICKPNLRRNELTRQSIKTGASAHMDTILHHTVLWTVHVLSNWKVWWEASLADQSLTVACQTNENLNSYTDVMLGLSCFLVGVLNSHSLACSAVLVHATLGFVLQSFLIIHVSAVLFLCLNVHIFV